MNLRPDLDDGDIRGDDDLSIGPRFLRDFEELPKHVADSKKTDDSVDATETVENGVGDEAAKKGDIAERGSGVKNVETKADKKMVVDMKTTIDTESAVKR